MKLIERHLGKVVLAAARKYPVISVTGPRQSGKTTLVKQVFADYQYVNFEDPELREFATNDPKGFLQQFNKPLILDEVQYVPNIFSYIQLAVDNNPNKGQFILTGSQNFLLLEQVSQSLAGRVAIFNLFPFSLEELKGTKYFSHSYEEYLYKGFYPRIYSDKLDAKEWLKNYTNTYIERDVRKIVNIGDLTRFQHFLKLCAGRVGQLVNFSEIGNELGVTYHTVQAWLSVLESSYIIFRLSPYYKNFNKRIIKSPKLYFYDTGLAAYLLGITKPDDVNSHFAKGALFENLIISEMIKYKTNNGMTPNIWFWRSSSGYELDCIVEDGKTIKAVEIKSGKTVTSDFFKGLNYWRDLTNLSDTYIVYGGDNKQERTNATVLPWIEACSIFNT